MDSLFSASPVREYRVRRYSESVYHFLDVSAWPSFNRLRTQWDRWFAQYPENKRAALASRFQSPIEHQHLSAAMELFTFGVLRQCGFEVEVEPQIGNYLLEFLATAGPNGAECYVECTVTGQSKTEASSDALEAEFLDAINKTTIGQFALGLSFDARGLKAPPAKKLRSELARWVASLDPDATKVTDFLWEHEGWQVNFHAFPLKGKANADDNAIGMTMNSMWVDEALRIRQAVDLKATKYGSLEKPLLVVVGSTEIQQDEELWEALLGGRVYQLNRKSKQVTETPKRNGVLFDTKGPRNTFMSTVLHAPFRSHSFASRESPPTITHHPYASLTLPHGLFPFADERWFDDDGKLVRVEAQCTVAEFFSLAEGWPHFYDDPHRA
jgi:hypothetical protein